MTKLKTLNKNHGKDMNDVNKHNILNIKKKKFKHTASSKADLFNNKKEIVSNYKKNNITNVEEQVLPQDLNSLQKEKIFKTANSPIKKNINTNNAGKSRAIDIDVKTENSDNFSSDTEGSENKGIKMFKGSTVLKQKRIKIEKNVKKESEHEEDNENLGEKDKEDSKMKFVTKHVNGNDDSSFNKMDCSSINSSNSNTEDLIENSNDNDVKEQSDNEGTIKKEQNKVSPEELLDKEKRTIFIGNIPKESTKTQIKKLFSVFGEIENIRIRGIIPEKLNGSKRIAAITKKIHANVNNLISYVTFKTENSAVKALKLNGTKFNGNYIRVDKLNKKQGGDSKKAIFLGNLSFKIEDNDIWEHFKDCGEIESVRVVRNGKTGVGIGVGYVNFKNHDSVALALELNGTLIHDREIRVKQYNDSLPKKKRQADERKPYSINKLNNAKRFKSGSTKSVSVDACNNESSRKKNKIKQRKVQSDKSMGNFQGQHANCLQHDKKKCKTNKKKKLIAAKLMGKSIKNTD
ncbi:RNA-binding protein 34-like [Prorops nasuta]|uniref:RNA-binding protein 34-like n=1 Tax=Prorops nasuta TaxID=863751 RepID=UPI0034CD7EC0